MRRWIAVRLDELGEVAHRIACLLWQAAERMRPPYQGPRCPDCGEPDRNPDEDCPVCKERWEAQQRDSAIYASGCEDGYREGRRNADWEIPF